MDPSPKARRLSAAFRSSKPRTSPRPRRSQKAARRSIPAARSKCGPSCQCNRKTLELKVFWQKNLDSLKHYLERKKINMATVILGNHASVIVPRNDRDS